MKLAGCSNHSGFINVSPIEESVIAQLKNDKDGTKIPLLTLDQLEGTILKMDCEGCEYDVIMNASKKTLQKFTHMAVGYHHGYKNLVEKLESCGFKTRVDVPRIAKGKDWGYVFAELN